MDQFPIREIVFYLVAIITLVPALIVVTTKNIIHATLALMLALSGVAGLYVFLNADFLFATQLMVYVGGILVLVLFGVMLTSGKLDMKLKTGWGQVWPGVIVAVIILALLLVVIIGQKPWAVTDSQIPATAEAIGPTTKVIGKKLIDKTGEFLLPFEIASVLLLVALVGAVLISRREVKVD